MNDGACFGPNEAKQAEVNNPFQKYKMEAKQGMQGQPPLPRIWLADGNAGKEDEVV